MYRTDDIGTWSGLGSVQGTYDWQQLPGIADGGNAVIRASFICSDWKKLNSYILIRPKYSALTTEVVGSAKRIYPNPTGNIVEMPIPSEFLDRSVYFRFFEVRKVLRWRRRIGITPDAILQISLEELWG